MSSPMLNELKVKELKERVLARECYSSNANLILENLNHITYEQFPQYITRFRDIPRSVRLIENGARISDGLIRGVFAPDILFSTTVASRLTMQCSNVEVVDARVKEVCGEMKDALGVTEISAFIFFSPPFTPGLPPHFDLRDFVALQLDGQKQWRLWDGPKQARISGNRETDTRMCQEIVKGKKPFMTIELAQNDFLYVPSPVVHAPSTGVEPSIHVTFGITRRALTYD